MSTTKFTHTFSVIDSAKNVGTSTFTSNHANATLAGAAHDAVYEKWKVLQKGRTWSSMTEERNAPNGVASADSDVRNKGMFAFEDTDDRVVTVSIPAWNSQYNLLNSKDIDLEDDDVKAYTQAVAAHGMTNSHGDDIVGVRYARETKTSRKTN